MSRSNTELAARARDHRNVCKTLAALVVLAGCVDRDRGAAPATSTMQAQVIVAPTSPANSVLQLMWSKHVPDRINDAVPLAWGKRSLIAVSGKGVVHMAAQAFPPDAQAR